MSLAWAFESWCILGSGESISLFWRILQTNEGNRGWTLQIRTRDQGESVRGTRLLESARGVQTVFFEIRRRLTQRNVHTYGTDASRRIELSEFSRVRGTVIEFSPRACSPAEDANSPRRQ